MNLKKKIAVIVKSLMFAIVSLLLIIFAKAEDYRPAGSIYYSAKTDEKLIALTFDDGPHKFRTDEILDVLEKYDVKATFFVIGAMAHDNPDIIRRELRLGHEIGNHTYNHSKMRKLSKKHLIEELESTENELYEIAEYRPKLFRPPEGWCSDMIASAVGSIDYDVILWNIDTLDWAHNEVDKICESVLEGVKPGSIVLFHDFVTGDSPTVEALEIIIPELQSQGYCFVTVSELINKGVS